MSAPRPVVPGWEILGALGRGSMGSVWKARRADGTLAAVKVIDVRGALTADEARSLFRREALACLNIDHPNLVRGIDAGTCADGRPFLAMEFVEGRSLAQLTAGGARLPEASVVRIAADVARGLDHAHRLGLLHRDVKPSNILVGTGGTGAAGGAAKLADLGLVAEQGRTGDGPQICTRSFAAPEILAGDAPTARADLFALGVTMAQAALGAHPSGTDPGTNRVRDGDLAAGFRLRGAKGAEELSPGFCAVVERLLRAAPGERYGSASELLLDLDAVAAGERPLGAILGAAAAAVPRTAGTRRNAVIVAVLLVAGGAVAASMLNRDDDVSPPPETPPAAAGTQSPAVPDLAATARLYAEKHPGDYPRIRVLLDEAEDMAASDGERAAVAALRAATERRFESDCAAAAAELRARAARLVAAGDFASAAETLKTWPEPLRGAAELQQLQAEAERLLVDARAAASALVRAATEALESGGEPPPELAARLAAASAAPRFPGDERLDVDRLRSLIDRRIQASAALRRAAEEAAARERRWRETVLATAASPGDGATRRMLEKLSQDAPPVVAAAAARILAADAAAGEAIGDLLATLRDRTWAGPVRGELFVGKLSAPPTPEDVFLSPLWLRASDARAALAAAVGAPEPAAAWFFVRGGWAECADDPDALVVAGFVEAPPSVAAGRVAPPDVALRDALAWRAPGAGVPVEFSSVAAGDAALAAWASAVSGSAPKLRSDAAATAAKAAARDAFLADDIAKAWTAIGAAIAADPGDGEMAALRARVLLSASRALPTTPALVAAFEEGRRAADLEPSLAAARLAAADAALAVAAAPSPSLAARVRPIAGHLCDEVAKVRRDDARHLVAAGEWHLEAGRAAPAADLLRRATAKGAPPARWLVLLARAELAAGRKDRARDALQRAAAANGGALPESAADLAAEIGK